MEAAIQAHFLLVKPLDEDPPPLLEAACTCCRGFL
jgi:hypothetical protein